MRATYDFTIKAYKKYGYGSWIVRAAPPPGGAMMSDRLLDAVLEGQTIVRKNIPR